MAGIRATQFVAEAWVNDTPPSNAGIRASQFVVEAWVNDTTPTATFPGTGDDEVCLAFPVCLDRKCYLLGVYSAGTGNTTWTLPVSDTSLTAAVLGPDFDVPGTIIAVTVSGLTATALGDYSDGPVVIGRPYTMSVELTRPYRRDQGGDAVISDRVQVLSIYTSHRRTGAYTVRVNMPRRTDRSKSFSATVGTLESVGELRYFASGKAEEMGVFIENATARPCAVSAVEFLTDIAPGVG